MRGLALPRTALAAVSSALSARRTSPSHARAKCAHASSSIVSPAMPTPSSCAIARRITRATSSSPSGWNLNTTERESNAGATAQVGFSVVAPKSTTLPASTPSSSASCWLRASRWISSTKSSVRRADSPSRRAAESIFSRSSLTPVVAPCARSVYAPVRAAMTSASVVLPVPGGPATIIDCSASCSISLRRSDPCARQCCCPAMSSSVRGRTRTASGAAFARRSVRIGDQRSSAIRAY